MIQVLKTSLAYGIVIIPIVFCSPANSQSQDQPALTRESYDVLNSARELMEENKFTEAESKLRQLLDTNPDRYDEAVTWQTLAHIYISTNDYRKAADCFIKSVKFDVLPENVTHEIYYNIARLLAVTNRYKESLEYLLPWFEREPSPGADAHILAASVFYELKDFPHMISHVQKAIQLSPKPDKALYDMLLTGYYQTEDFKQAANLLEKMIVLYPDDGMYWTQLAATYQLSKQYRKALAMYELALKKGLLDEANTLRLVHLYLQENLPYKAASLLSEKIESGILQKTAENLELLANSWLLARETGNAITALSHLANIKNDPDIYYRIGRLHFDQENWEDAISSLEKATKIENPDTQAEAYLLMGIAAYHLNQTAQSSRALNKALSREITREQANWWLNKLGKKLEAKTG